jgi:hypothetical protein
LSVLLTDNVHTTLSVYNTGDGALEHSPSFTESLSFRKKFRLLPGDATFPGLDEPFGFSVHGLETGRNVSNVDSFAIFNVQVNIAE